MSDMVSLERKKGNNLLAVTLEDCVKYMTHEADTKKKQERRSATKRLKLSGASWSMIDSKWYPWQYLEQFLHFYFVT